MAADVEAARQIWLVIQSLLGSRLVNILPDGSLAFFCGGKYVIFREQQMFFLNDVLSTFLSLKLRCCIVFKIKYYKLLEHDKVVLFASLRFRHMTRFGLACAEC